MRYKYKHLSSLDSTALQRLRGHWKRRLPLSGESVSFVLSARDGQSAEPSPNSALLALLDNHLARSIQIDTILVLVFTGHGIVVLGLRLDGDNLAARKSLKRDYRRQIFLQRFIFDSERRNGKERHQEKRLC